MECLVRQVAEVQALQAVFWEPGAVRLSAAESEAFLLAQAIVDGSLPQPVEALGDLCLSGTVFIVGTELHGGPVGLRFVLPPSYPSEVAQLTVECSAPRALHERLCDVVRAVAAATVGEESLLLAAEALKDAANDAATCAAAAGNRTGTAAAASPAAASDSEDELGHSAVSQEEQFSASSAACSTGTGETRAMGGPRAGDGGSRSCGYCATLVWFHHILSSTKKRCLVLWARELGVSGYCKPGYPGVLVIEGEEREVEAYLSRVKSLSWQAMQVRGTLTMAGDVAQDSAASAGGAATAGLKVPPRRFRRLAAAGSGAGALELLPETGGMSELAQLCQEAGLRGLFLTALKLPGR